MPEFVADVDDTTGIQIISREADLIRSESIELRRKRQMVQEDSMKKYQATDLKAKGLGIGAVVTARIDARDHSHAQGLLAIVYKVGPYGGALVVCEHGVLTSSGTQADFWMPHSQYRIVARAEEKTTLAPALLEIRKKVIDGNYDYQNAPRISLLKYHEMVVGANSPLKKGKCMCAKGNCTKRCGCYRSNRKCSSTCSCSGKCSNSHE